MVVIMDHIIVIIMDLCHLATRTMGKAPMEATGADGKFVEATTVTASFEFTWW